MFIKAKTPDHYFPIDQIKFYYKYSIETLKYEDKKTLQS